MKRLLSALGACLITAALASGGSIGGPYLLQGETLPGRSINIVKQFEGGKRACAIMTGKKQCYLGLYVYDADGNCIARDDHATLQTSDDAAVEWYPTQTGRFSIEVRALAGSRDQVYLVIQ